MKTKLITVMLAVLVAVPSFCYASNSPDKQKHIGVSCAIGVAMAQNKPFNKWKPRQRALFNVVVVGGAKEWYDSKHPEHHTAEWGDIAADAIGAVSAEGVVWLYHKTF